MFGELLEGRMDGFCPCHHHNIPTGLEPLLIEPVNFPQSSADPVAHVCLTQFFADGNSYPIGIRAIASGIEHQTGIGLTGSAVKPLEYVIEL